MREQPIVPNLGTKRRRYLDDNVAALDVELSAAELAQIDDIAPATWPPAGVIVKQ